MTLVDLVEPPQLLIIRLGVKVARNQAMPEVFMEGVQLRLHTGKPTWIWDQPDYPFREGHLCWSTYGESLVESFPLITPTSNDTPKVAKKGTTSTAGGGSIRDIMLGKGGAK
jgi:hypothetical protein